MVVGQLEFHLTHGSNMFLALPDKLSYITEIYHTISYVSLSSIPALA
jgi:hypothetical protein